MVKIIKFTLINILKNRIVLFYTIILSAFSWSVFGLEDNTSKGILSLLNVILLTVPLVSIIFACIYIYNSVEFIEMMVSQPVKRSKIWLSLFAGMVLAMNMAFLLGAGIPIAFFAPTGTGLILVATGCMLTTIFISLAMLCSILTRDKAKGIGLSVMMWLFFTLLFDGLTLFLMFQFADYPIEKGMIMLTSMNPVDLARILVLLQLDVSALMGYTGAIFKDFFGTFLGVGVAFFLLLLWFVIPFSISLAKFKNKDL